MDDEEIKKFIEHVQRKADPNYLTPPEEMLGKFMVCKDYQILSVFDTEEEAMQEATRHEAGSIEIRQPLPSDDGTRTRVIVPGAIKYVGPE